MIPKNRIHSSKNAPFKPASLHIHCAQLSNPNPPKPHGCGWRSAHSLGPGIDHLTEHIHPGQNTRLEKAEKAEIGACSHVTCVHPFSLFGNVTCQFQSGSYHWSIHHHKLRHFRSSLRFRLFLFCLRLERSRDCSNSNGTGAGLGRIRSARFSKLAGLAANSMSM
jgi:hypothetical protein